MADWQIRRSHIVASLQRVMGVLPDRKPAPDVKIIEEKAIGSIVRRRITYQSDAARVPAYLLLPATAKGRLPAMLCLHQTTPFGKDEPAGVRGDPQLRYALELAEHGYACIVPDYPSFGEHHFGFANSAYASGTMKALWDNIRAVDVLETLEGD